MAPATSNLPVYSNFWRTLAQFSTMAASANTKPLPKSVRFLQRTPLKFLAEYFLAIKKTVLRELLVKDGYSLRCSKENSANPGSGLRGTLTGLPLGWTVQVSICILLSRYIKGKYFCGIKINILCSPQTSVRHKDMPVFAAPIAMN